MTGDSEIPNLREFKGSFNQGPRNSSGSQVDKINSLNYNKSANKRRVSQADLSKLK